MKSQFPKKQSSFNLNEKCVIDRKLTKHKTQTQFKCHSLIKVIQNCLSKLQHHNRTPILALVVNHFVDDSLKLQKQSNLV